jgi:predicted nucleic acid-binding protein
VTVVSDTSPISYLVLIGREEVIAELYGEVLVPEAVHRELVHPRGPEVVRERISSSPSWMEVEASGSDEEGLPLPEGNRGDLKELDPGEREAILLAVREEAGLLLIDERAGRAAARKRGVTVTGTIGVLGAAAQNGLIDPARAVRDLRETTFRASPDLYRWLLDKGK